MKKSEYTIVMKQRNKEKRKFLCAGIAVAIAFSCVGGVGCKKKTGEGITVYMPSGAPAVAMTKLLKEDTANDGVSYYVVDPQTIKTYVNFADGDKNADLCVLPANVASMLLGSGEKYTMLGTVTNGNLYLVSSSETEITDVALLTGKTVGIMSKQITAVPALTFKATLQKAGVAWQQFSNDNQTPHADKVNIKPIGDVWGCDYYLLAEPTASTNISGSVGTENELRLVGDLQELYAAATNSGTYGYPQAVLVAKNSLLSEKPEFVQAFAKKVAESAEWVKTADGETIAAAVRGHFKDKTYTDHTMTAAVLKADVVGRCGIRFSYAVDCKADMDEYLAAVNVATPADAFYWTYRGE